MYMFVGDTHVHTSDELARLHPRKVPVNTRAQLLIIPRHRLVDLPDRLADTGRTQKPTGKASNVATETELSVRVRAHEVKVLFDVIRQIAQHIGGGEAGRGEGVTGAGGEVVDEVSADLEHGWEALGEVLDHDFVVEFFDGGVDDLAGADGELGLVFDETAAFFEALEVAGVDADPAVAGLFLDSYFVSRR